MEYFGKYKLVKSENFEEFLKELGVNFALRKIAVSSTPTVQFTKDGDEYTFGSYTTFKNVIIKFKMGEEFEETTPDGRTVLCTFTFEDNKLIQIQKGAKHIVKIVREFSEKEYVTYIFINDVLTCTRWFQLIE